MIREGIPFWPTPWLARSTDLYLVKDGNGGQPKLLCFSIEAALQMIRGVRWHDEPGHCPTFTSACRCDMGPEA